MRIALTGAAGGIGQAVAEQLVADHEVLAVDVDSESLAGLPAAVETTVLDLRDEAAVREQLAGETLDAVVSAVGWYELAAIEDCPPATLRKHLESNLVAVHTAVHAALPTIRERSGRIVVVGSLLGRVALPYHGAYSASKAALGGYVDSLRREVARHDVAVSLVEPGPVRTGLNRRAAEALSEMPDSAYADEYDSFEGYEPQAVDPETVATRVKRALDADRPRARYPVSARARWLPRLGAVLPTWLFDRLVRAGLPGGILGRLVD